MQILKSLSVSLFFFFNLGFRVKLSALKQLENNLVGKQISFLWLFSVCELIFQAVIYFAGIEQWLIKQKTYVSGCRLRNGVHRGTEYGLVTLGNEVERLTRQKILMRWSLNSWDLQRVRCNGRRDVQLIETDHLVGLSNNAGLFSPPLCWQAKRVIWVMKLLPSIIKNQVVQFCWLWNLRMQSSYTLGGEMER